VVQAWIGGRDLQVTAWSVKGSDVDLTLTGPDAPASPEELAHSLAAAFGSPVKLDMHYIASSHSETISTP
jgi:hypothetical protein